MDTVNTKREEFSELVLECQASLRAYIRALGADADWVDDLAQECLLIAYRKFEKFDMTRDFSKWLRGIARNIVLNERKKNARRSRLMSDFLSDVLLKADADQEQSVHLQEILPVLDGCVGKLPQKSRNLLQQRYQSNENASVLAVKFNMSAVSIRQSLMKIRRLVQECIKQTAGEVAL